MIREGTGEEHEDYLSVHLFSRSERQITAKFNIFILNAKQEKIQTWEAVNNSTIYCKFDPREDDRDDGWVFNKFIKLNFLLNEANGLLIDDTLTLHCDIVTLTESTSTSKQSVGYNVPKSRLADDLYMGLLDRRFSDAILSVDGEEIPVHKFILSTRSPVFAAMFEAEMVEKKNNIVKIEDLTYEDMKELLVFIYTDKTPNLVNMAYSLLVAADKYAVERLKVLCEEEIGLHLGVENVTNVLVMADHYNASQLKERVLDFIITHITSVASTDGWKDLISNHPNLSKEIFQEVIVQNETMRICLNKTNDKK
jgi:speckle-type POZ protein